MDFRKKEFDLTTHFYNFPSTDSYISMTGINGKTYYLFMVYYISRKIDLERGLNSILNKLIAIKIGVISSLLIIFVCLLNLIDYYLGL